MDIKYLIQISNRNEANCIEHDSVAVFSYPHIFSSFILEGRNIIPIREFTLSKIYEDIRFDSKLMRKIMLDESLDDL